MATATRKSAPPTRPIRSEYDVCEALKPRAKLPTVRPPARQRLAEFTVGCAVGALLDFFLGAIGVVAALAR